MVRSPTVGQSEENRPFCEKGKRKLASPALTSWVVVIAAALTLSVAAIAASWFC
jgi:hypothetical protein